MKKETLEKSLKDLDQATEELLKKSKSDDVTPTDISDDDTESNEDDTADVKKGENCDNCEDGVKKSDNCEDSVKKSDNDDSNDDDSDEDDDEDVKKSLDDFQTDATLDFQADPDISVGIQNSEFQAAIVATLAKALSEIQYDIYNNKKSGDNVSATLVKSLKAIITTNDILRAENDKLSRRVAKLEKSLNKGFGEILDAIDTLSTQPASVRKSVNSISVHDRDFNKSLNGTGAGFESLSKAQVLSILNTEIYSGNPAVSATDIISFESGAPLRPEVQTLVMNKCK